LSKYNLIEKYLLKNSIFLITLTLSNSHIFISSFLPNNTLSSSKKNISSHYDIGNDLYQKMLGPTMQYTCAYYYKDNLTLDQAQKAKMTLIAKKLNLKSGMKIVDIGCGYGSMAQFLAINYNVSVIGVTLSKQQKIYADKYFSHPNVTIEVKDYRYLTGKFDRVYSVGTFEHIGVKNYPTYFNKCYQLLNDDGIMIIHTIGTSQHHLDNQNEWIKKYIFPEGQLPYISKIINYKNIDKWNLEDMQNFGMSYAKTLRAWRKNIGNWETLDKYDSTFRRMWDFYLYGCAASFQLRKIYLWQFVFTKKGVKFSNDLHHIRKCD
jgi:cyclopropane-fatty-acyl-phospholipid synthase